MIRSAGNDFQAYYGREQREYEKNLPKDAGYLKKMIPIKTVPTAPMPVQMA